MVQRYFDRLSKYNSSKVKEKEFAEPALNKLSYKEIATIAVFFDHREAMAFRRVSRMCNYSTCFAILQNIESF